MLGLGSDRMGRRTYVRIERGPGQTRRVLAPRCPVCGADSPRATEEPHSWGVATMTCCGESFPMMEVRI